MRKTSTVGVPDGADDGAQDSATDAARDAAPAGRAAADPAGGARPFIGAGRREWRAKAHELSELVQLKGFERAYPRELSGGMRQRVAIARALSYNPEILLMDEPFGALDAMTRDRMNLELQAIAATTGATVVFVTHSITEAVFLADRVVLLSARPGRLRSVTPIQMERPRDLELQSDPAFQDTVRELRHQLYVN